ncbi:MAG: DUF1273 domain-containing protein [Oscillospiraceae bacterium]|nr:DUF1273 domain-containing protein [Oscillospiraceae bacterium]
MENLKINIESLVKNGVTTFLSGAAIGFDIAAALAVIETKRTFPNIKLALALPCENQTKNWCPTDIVSYNYIIEQADTVTYISKRYYAGCMHKRNRYLVENSAFCICYLKKTCGGTYYTVEYAKKNGLNIKNLAQIE